ncbi:MAG: hypothetical protein KAJ19_00500 [Gammaproteobacteria bacterium]|nr:hypothetical protein [Gammaproteobacteria bacterium]
MDYYRKVMDSEGNEFFIKATDAPLLGTDEKVTVYEQWPGCRIERDGLYVSYTCTRRSNLKTKKYLGCYLRIVENDC